LYLVPTVRNADVHYHAPHLTSEEDCSLSEDDIARCCYGLLASQIFKNNEEYVRRQFVFGLLQVQLKV